MTRQEEIRTAVDTIVPILPSNNGRTYEQALIASGFEEGVKWADKNPKSPWISVKDDLPCNHSDLVLTYNDTPFSTKRVMVDDRGWIWNYLTKDKITHWFPIPELPK